MGLTLREALKMSAGKISHTPLYIFREARKLRNIITTASVIAVRDDVFGWFRVIPTEDSPLMQSSLSRSTRSGHEG